MHSTPPPLPHPPPREPTNATPTNRHPRDQYAKVRPQMTLRTKYHRPRRLNTMIERHRIPILVEAGHDLEARKRAARVTYQPDIEEVRRPLHAYERKYGLHYQPAGAHREEVEHPKNHEACASRVVMACERDAEGEYAERVHEREEHVCGEGGQKAYEQGGAEREDVAVTFGAGAEDGEGVECECE